MDAVPHRLDSLDTSTELSTCASFDIEDGVGPVDRPLTCQPVGLAAKHLIMYSSGGYSRPC